MLISCCDELQRKDCTTFRLLFSRHLLIAPLHHTTLQERMELGRRCLEDCVECVWETGRGSEADWMEEAVAISYLPALASRPDTLPPCSFPVSWQRSWIMYPSVCPSLPSTGHWVSCQLVIGSLQVKMTCGGAAALALSPCPALDRRHSTQSLPMAWRKGDRGDRGGGNEPQCSPNPPKWNWQARWSNCSQHYFLWQEILLSTNRGFNKRQEMRL